MGRFYYCLAHDQVEQGATCRAENRLGPYETRQAALDWRERHEGREETWEAEDERWHGRDDD